VNKEAVRQFNTLCRYLPWEMDLNNRNKFLSQETPKHVINCNVRRCPTWRTNGANLRRPLYTNYPFSYEREYICCMSLKILGLQVWHNHHEYLLTVKMSNADTSTDVACWNCAQSSATSNPAQCNWRRITLPSQSTSCHRRPTSVNYLQPSACKGTQTSPSVPAAADNLTISTMQG